jgi:hypothetical protein
MKKFARTSKRQDNQSTSHESGFQGGFSQPSLGEEAEPRFSRESNECSVAPPGADTILSNAEGQPLGTAVRAFMEPRFGHDFSKIRVHADKSSNDVASVLEARAFTLGQHIYFGAGAYQPDSPASQAVLAHELAHSVQQGDQAGPAPDRLTSLPISQAGEPLEREAEAAAQAITSGEAMAEISHRSPYSIQRLSLNPYKLFAPSLTPREQIDAALKSKKPSDVKAIEDFSPATLEEKLQLITILLQQGWVGPFDEWALEDIWRSFGDNVLQMGAAHFDVWKQCVDRGAELEKLPAVVEAQKKFLTDVETIARYYLHTNQDYIEKETERLGLQQCGVSPQQDRELQEMQQAARILLTAQEQQAQLRQITVGYDVVEGEEGFSYLVPVGFDPMHKPDMTERPQPGEAVVGEAHTPPVPWEEVNKQYQKTVALITALTSRYPALFALAGQDRQADLRSVAQESPEQARAVISQVLQGVSQKITETIPKIGREIDSRDLISIHQQLYNGMEPPSGTSGLPWNNPIYKWVAQEAIGDYQAKEFWTNLGLTAAAAIALIGAEIATGGLATFFLAAGVGIGLFQAEQSWEKYLNLAQASQATITPETSLILEGQVTGALTDAILNTVNAFIMAYGPLAKGTEAASQAAKIATESEPAVLAQATLREADTAIAEANQAKQALAGAGEMELAATRVEQAEQSLTAAEQKLVEATKAGQALESAEQIEAKIVEIEEARQGLSGAQQAPSGLVSGRAIAPRLLDKGFSSEALEALQKTGLDISEKSSLARQLMAAGDTTRDFINTFYKSPGIERVISAWAGGGKTQVGVRFVMKYCLGRLKGTSLMFEWPAGILDTAAGGETWARYIDIVVEGGSRVKPGEAMAIELKSWTGKTLSKSTSKVTSQLVRDTALYGPGNVRWVFDGTKVSREEVIETFLKIITNDGYLTASWGNSTDEIRQAIEAMIEVYQ